MGIGWFAMHVHIMVSVFGVLRLSAIMCRNYLLNNVQKLTFIKT